MKKEIVIENTKKEVRLRTINDKDIDKIRIWKNKNKERFFYKKEITAEEQKKWYANYLKREDDYIFVSEVFDGTKWETYGCIGYRVVGEGIDLYNVIRGNKTNAISSMKKAMKLIVKYLSKHSYEFIKCDVLVDNPAVEWYNECGFVIKEKYDDYYVMQYIG